MRSDEGRGAGDGDGRNDGGEATEPSPNGWRTGGGDTVSRRHDPLATYLTDPGTAAQSTANERPARTPLGGFRPQRVGDDPNEPTRRSP